jgi:hypothetical protein
MSPSYRSEKVSRGLSLQTCATDRYRMAETRHPPERIQAAPGGSESARLEPGRRKAGAPNSQEELTSSRNLRAVRGERFNVSRSFPNKCFSPPIP